MAKSTKKYRTRLELLQEFYDAPPDALFPQEPIAAVLGCSCASLERARWAGGGIPFIKVGRGVRYRKSVVLASLDACPLRGSTTNAGRIEQ